MIAMVPKYDEVYNQKEWEMNKYFTEQYWVFIDF